MLETGKTRDGQVLDLGPAVDANPVRELSVGFRDDGSEAPSVGGFDFLDEIDAVRILGCLEPQPFHPLWVGNAGE